LRGNPVMSANDPKRTLDVVRIFGLDGRESYLELRLEPLYWLPLPSEPRNLLQ
jgi:hypothetical protein